MFYEGVEHGPYVMWHENGNKGEQGVLKHGNQHGKKAKWFSDGALDAEEWYLDGQEHGLFIRWHPNGTKCEQVAFVNAKANGPYACWYQNGTKALEGGYLQGGEFSVWRGWASDGSLVFKKDKYIRLSGSNRTTIDGGEWSYYPPPHNHQAMTETMFDKGAKTSEKFFDVFGKLVWERQGDSYKEYPKDPAAEKERKEVVDPALRRRDWLLNRTDNSEYLVYRNLIHQQRLNKKQE